MDGPQRGLLGGSGRVWLEKGLHRPRFDSPCFLDPVSSPEDADSLRTFLDHDLLEVEVGCGRGWFIEEMASTWPDRRFLVIEARGRYVRMALRRLDRARARNVRVVYGDARELLGALVPPRSLRALYLLFPDPWWKNRHVKKRISTPEFLDAVRTRLREDGVLVFRTDVEEYAARMDALAGDLGLERAAALPEGTALSHRHRKCLALGIPVWERAYRCSSTRSDGPQQGGRS
jgi:tRNA (guanine-N7-)-methyltransferase